MMASRWSIPPSSRRLQRQKEVRLVIALAAHEGWEVHYMDIKSADGLHRRWQGAQSAQAEEGVVQAASSAVTLEREVG
jgi:hypothetical protein